MTYAFIESYMRRVQNEYLEITSHNGNHKVNIGFDHISVEIFQRIEAYQINRIYIKTKRKHDRRQLHKYLDNKLNYDVASKIIGEYLSPWDSIYIQVDVHYDPLIQNPEWKLRILQVIGLDASEFIIQMVKQMSQREELGLRMDLRHFIGKLDKLLKHL
jgi:hypothetical protein